MKHNCRITVSKEPCEIDVKRCYLPIVVHSKCPECGHERSRDMDDRYLSYPTLNVPTRLHFECNPCGEDEDRPVCKGEWNVYIRLGLTVTAVAEPTEPE